MRRLLHREREKLCRLLIMTRKNYVMALVRPAFSKRGPSHELRLHHPVRAARRHLADRVRPLHKGRRVLPVRGDRAEYFIPVIVLLKAFVNTTDRAIYDRMVSTPLAAAEGAATDNSAPDTYVADRVEIMLKMTRKDLGLQHHEQCLSYLGNAFRVVLGVPDAM